ncbi:S1 RNA-binding domain-containing protein [Patescibacteria group bacterium]|nr:S1 RNA-binding domain-containing protein [Patescibacteria group bacterium]
MNSIIKTSPEFNLNISRGLKKITIGSLMNGFVLAKRPKELLVDLKNLGLARIYGQEYNRAKSLINKINPGDEVIVKITKFDDGYGNYEGSLQDIQEINQWQKIKNFLKTKKVLELKVIDANKGGLIVEVEGVKGFVPVSQLSPEHYPRISNNNKQVILNHLKNFVGQSFPFRIINAEPSNQKLILSERSALEETSAQAINQFNVGQIVDVKIVGLGKFGIFVRFNDNPPLDGLVHISEIPEKEQELETRFEIGNSFKAKIIKIEGDRANFSLKDLNEDPWLIFSKDHQVGSIIKGRVSQKTNDIFATVDFYKIKGAIFENLDKIKENEDYEFKIEDLNIKEKKLILKLI